MSCVLQVDLLEPSLAQTLAADYDALTQLLTDGRLAGGGLDVYPDETIIPTGISNLDAYLRDGTLLTSISSRQT